MYAAPPTPEPAPTPSKDYGPMFVGEPASDTAFPTAQRPGDPPRFSVGKGAFCFVDNSWCRSSLILTADVGIGTNVVRGPKGSDLPYAQFAFRGGIVLRPLMLSRSGGWHPWGIGLLGSWSRGTAPPSTMTAIGRPHTDAWRVIVVNQFWLSKKRNGFHLDLDIGVVRSTVAGSANGQFYGSHGALSANWGGWGGLFVSADFLDKDTRVVFGFRGHGMVTAPAIGLVLLGLLAGGAFGGAS